MLICQFISLTCCLGLIFVSVIKFILYNQYNDQLNQISIKWACQGSIPKVIISQSQTRL